MSDNSRSLCLYIAGATGDSKRFALPDGETIIGRESSSGIVLSDPSISRRHAKITVSADQILIQDGVEEPSSNGVYLNNQRISGETDLAEGDVLKMGVFRFEVLRLSENETPVSITQVTGVSDLVNYLEQSEINLGDENDIISVVRHMGLTEQVTRKIFDDALDSAMRRSELRKVAMLSKIKLNILEDLWSGRSAQGESGGAGKERDTSSKAIVIALMIAAIVLIIVALSNIVT